MDELAIITNIYTILSNTDFNIQFIYFCCGVYNTIEFYSDFQIKGPYYIIGKILSDFKFDIEHYIKYLIIVIENRDTILKFQNEINIINNLHLLLNSQQKNDFILFLSGFYQREDWGQQIEQYGNSFIVGRLMDIKEDKIFTLCKFLLKNHLNMDMQENEDN